MSDRCPNFKQHGMRMFEIMSMPMFELYDLYQNASNFYDRSDIQISLARQQGIAGFSPQSRHKKIGGSETEKL